MKSVNLKDVKEYDDSDEWLHQEVSGRLLICLPSFVFFQQEICEGMINYYLLHSKLLSSNDIYIEVQFI